MRTLQVALSERTYPIHIGNGLLGDAGSYGEFRGRPLKLITDTHVARHYLPAVSAALGLHETDSFVLPAGEEQKTWANSEKVLDWLLAARLPRDGCLVALGGGVIGDLVGFCASIYQRGIDFIQIPTTLLAQVDSSVGGKTGVNHARGKNMIGAIHQPRLVIADSDALQTLPQRELLAGIAEVIKYGMLADAAFFERLEHEIPQLLMLDAAVTASIIGRCCELKAGIVAQDERESISGGPRALLNLGHTFGHAIETHTGYTQWLHGEAVATGLCMAADLSARLGWLSSKDAARCAALIRKTGLPVRPPAGMTPRHFLELMSLDKKVMSGKLRLVLMRGIGQAVLSKDFDPAALQACLEHFTNA